MEFFNKNQNLLSMYGSFCSRNKVARLVMNYLIKEGFRDVAEKFKKESNMNVDVKLNSLDDRMLIREALLSGRIEDAMDLINDMYPGLLDNNSYLFFHIQQLQLIELIRNGDVSGALNFAQTKLVSTVKNISAAQTDLERTLSLLAFENPEDSAFAGLLDHSYRQKIASEVNTAILKHDNINHSIPNVLFLLKLIKWAEAELRMRDIIYPKMINFENGLIISQQNLFRH